MVIKVTCLPTFILMMCLAAVSRPMILVLIGEQWEECANYLQIICFSAMLFPLHALNLNAIQVMGRSDLTLKIKVLKTLLQIIPITLGIIFNIYWMLISSIFTSLVSYYLNAYYSKPLLNYGISEQVKDILPSIGISFGIAIPIYALSFISISPFVLLPLQILVGGLWGILLLEMSKLPEYLELKSILYRR